MKRSLCLFTALSLAVAVCPLRAEPGLSAPAAPAPEARLERSDAELYQFVLGGIALVRSDFGEGTGWLLSKQDRLMVTNHHVVARNTRRSEDLWVIFPVRTAEREVIAERSYYEQHGRKLEIRARLVYSSPTQDLALLRLERVPESVHELPLAPAGARQGELVRSVGNPGKSEALWVHNSGTVRQIYSKEVRYRSGQQVKARMIETQQPIAGGDSGSPVVNGKGEVVGVVACGVDGPLFNYAIELRELQAFLADAKEKERAQAQDDLNEAPKAPARLDKYGSGRTERPPADRERPPAQSPPDSSGKNRGPG
ncbi:MAG TPA: serine protease [Gemmatales bacterium]|nr:serine protease [Gemmatales bacterium]